MNIVVVGFARMDGRTVGIVANQPAVSPECSTSAASVKTARFVRFCDCFNIPLLTALSMFPALCPAKTKSTAAPSVTVPSCSTRSSSDRSWVTLITTETYGGAYDVMSIQARSPT